MIRFRFKTFKNEILSRAKEQGACKTEYARALKAQTFEELMGVIKDNFEWVVTHKIIDEELVGEYRKEFSENDIVWNKDLYKGFLLVTDNAEVVAHSDFAGIYKGYWKGFCRTRVYAYDYSIVIAHEDTFVKAFNRAKVHANDNAKVDAYGKTTVEANENAKVYAKDNSTVYALDNSTVKARDNSTVYAHDNSTVYANDNSTVYAYGNSTVKARDNSTVYAHENTKVDAYDKTTVYAYGDSMICVYGDSTVYAYENAKVEAYGNNVKVIYKRPLSEPSNPTPEKEEKEPTELDIAEFLLHELVELLKKLGLFEKLEAYYREKHTNTHP